MSVISKGAALRIALAARTLDGVDPRVFTARLGERIAGRLGLPITEEKLLSVTVTEIKLLLVGEDTVESMVEPEQDMDAIKRAVRYLWGENGETGDVPVAEAALDLPGSLRVAIASNHGENLDGHFGSALRFLVYQVNRENVRLVDVRSTAGADASDDRNAARAALIRDCQILYLQSIGGPAAAKVVRAGVYPVKVKTPGPAREALAQLQTILDAPPPWLARVMGVQAKSLARFAEDLEAA